jgi:hypothetical protein
MCFELTLHQNQDWSAVQAFSNAITLNSRNLIPNYNRVAQYKIIGKQDISRKMLEYLLQAKLKTKDATNLFDESLCFSILEQSTEGRLVLPFGNRGNVLTVLDINYMMARSSLTQKNFEHAITLFKNIIAKLMSIKEVCIL